MTMRRPSSSGSSVVSMRTNRRHRQVLRGTSDETLANREGDRLGAAAGVELGHDVVQDVLDGALGVGEFAAPPRASDGRRRSAPGPAARDRSGGRRRARARCSRAAWRAGARAGRRRRRRCRRPPREPPRRASRGQFVLAQVADSARLQSGKRRVLAAVGRADDHPRAGRLAHSRHEIPSPRAATGPPARGRPRTKRGAPTRRVPAPNRRLTRPPRGGPDRPPVLGGRSCGCRGRRASPLRVVAGRRNPGDTTRSLSVRKGSCHRSSTAPPSSPAAMQGRCLDARSRRRC